jgi:hypothetical protein
MEGLKGTAIRLAVRDPRLPAGPGPYQGSAAPGPDEGLLLRVAQATTTHTGSNDALPIPGRRVARQPAKGAAGHRDRLY